MPSWLRGDVLDVRKVVSVWAAMNRTSDNQQINTKVCFRLPPLTVAYHVTPIGSFRLLTTFGR